MKIDNADSKSFIIFENRQEVLNMMQSMIELVNLRYHDATFLYRSILDDSQKATVVIVLRNEFYKETEPLDD